MSVKENLNESLLANEVASTDQTRSPTSGNSSEIMASRFVCGGPNFTVAVLFFINLLNYMDRFTIVGVLSSIQKYFDEEENSVAGLLQTVFVCSYMVFAPIFGYLGDRLRRKYLMALGILVWSGTVFASTLLDQDDYWYFLLLRGVVGIGEASYSTMAPTIIGDLFTGDMRTKMLSIFYFAIPVGSGLGYVVGSKVAHALGSWQWGMRVTPVLGVACVLLCLFVVHEPPRGAIERGFNPNLLSASTVHQSTSYWDDLKYLFKVKSFIWLDLGFTCVAFVTGSLAFWAPKFLYYAAKMQDLHLRKDDITFNFGLITCAAGIVGVWLGAELARRWRVYNKRADALICAIGLIGCTPFLYLAIVFAHKSLVSAYVTVFIGEVLLCMNWAPVGDMVLYVIIPPRRSSAGAVQILISHLFGDAGSPWLIGEVSDLIRGARDTDEGHQTSMEYALLINTFIAVLGGLCFILCAFYIVADREAADRHNHDDDDESLLSSVAGDLQDRDMTDRENSTEGLSVPVDVHNCISSRPQLDQLVQPPQVV
ncbi:predicted protein [Nematostella vectensis]|uniref:Major facilitator superfamily (MFS) profile domain-containing protein n=1 Tax=Nematostella vectensis TaxID=45351 RepID=A7SA53_NEMVE|nr:protein spinster homolog 1 [Nematostella vectensis]EDO39433.1 predicted protein [Nematostella vectensis]|eukprot:XP_001631496.1 predicted protein [Nematostella vectensis]